MVARKSRPPRRRSRVRVRSRDGGTALEIDGTWASHRRRGKETTASVWDALTAPLLARAEIRRPRVLILGLGGGSAARVVRAIAPGARIVGVERDPDVVRVARRAFGLDEIGVEVIRADARDYVVGCRRRFDFVIEDVFVGSGVTPHKPEGLPNPGLQRTAGRVAAGGILVSNSLDEAAAVRRAQCALWRYVLELRVAGFDNRIFAGSQAPLEARSLRRSLARSVLWEGLGALRIRRVRP